MEHTQNYYDRSDQLTLGQLLKRYDKIRRIEKIDFAPVMIKMPFDQPLVFTDGKEADSYRGYYKDLAIEYSQGISLLGLQDNIRTFQYLRNKLGKTMEGYKGGEFPINEDTFLWVSSWGVCSNIYVTDLLYVNNIYVLLTNQQDVP